MSFGGFHASYGIKLGIWLGLIAALAIAAGGYLQLRAEDDPPRGAVPAGVTASRSRRARRRAQNPATPAATGAP